MPKPLSLSSILLNCTLFLLLHHEDDHHDHYYYYYYYYYYPPCLALMNPQRIVTPKSWILIKVLPKNGREKTS